MTALRRARRSTVLLAVLFAATLLLYLQVRPDPVAARRVLTPTVQRPRAPERTVTPAPTPTPPTTRPPQPRSPSPSHGGTGSPSGQPVPSAPLSRAPSPSPAPVLPS